MVGEGTEEDKVTGIEEGRAVGVKEEEEEENIFDGSSRSHESY